MNDYSFITLCGMMIHIMSRTVDVVLCNGVQRGGNATGSEDAVKQCKRPQQVQAYSSQVYFLNRQFSSTPAMEWELFCLTSTETRMFVKDKGWKGTKERRLNQNVKAVSALPFCSN